MCIACENPSINGATHLVCSKYTPVSSLNTPFTYSGAVKKIIISAKESQRSYTLLRNLLSHPENKYLTKTLPKTDFITPVPASKSKGRIINHAGYIAENLGSEIQNVLIKLSSQQQKALTISERWRLRDDIRIKPRSKNVIRGKRILLVDDVTTTGATFFKCASILKQAGAAEIHCYALAKDLKLGSYA